MRNCSHFQSTHYREESGIFSEKGRWPVREMIMAVGHVKIITGLYPSLALNFSILT